MQDADIQPDGSAELELTQQHLDTLAHMNGVMQWLSPNADREYIRENARHMKALYALMMVTTVGDQLDERDARDHVVETLAMGDEDEFTKLSDYDSYDELFDEALFELMEGNDD
jgi:hypothetical protein